MSDFSLTTLFVTNSGTLASAGSTQNLTAQQIGVFKPDYSIATTGDIAAQKYIYIAQGRVEQIPGLGSKRSDKIAANKVIEWYKVTAVSSVPTQIQSISGWSLECDQQIHFSFVLHSNYIDAGYFNGLTQTVTVGTPCCACGANPCASIDAAATQAFVDEAVAKLNANQQLNPFLTFSRFGTGASSQIYITEKPLPAYSNPCNFEAYSQQFDRLWFRAYVYANPATHSDFYVADECDLVATTTVLQRSDFATGSSEEIAQLEKNLWSYQVSHFKHLYAQNAWNQAYASYVVAGTFYDTFYIKYYAYDEFMNTWRGAVEQDNTVIVAFPTGTGTAFQTLLTAYLGAPTDYSGTNPTTTSTTSTSSTSTTSTSTLIP